MQAVVSFRGQEYKYSTEQGIICQPAPEPEPAPILPDPVPAFVTPEPQSVISEPSIKSENHSEQSRAPSENNSEPYSPPRNGTASRAPSETSEKEPSIAEKPASRVPSENSKAGSDTHSYTISINIDQMTPSKGPSPESKSPGRNSKGSGQNTPTKTLGSADFPMSAQNSRQNSPSKTSISVHSEAPRLSLQPPTASSVASSRKASIGSKLPSESGSRRGSRAPTENGSRRASNGSRAPSENRISNRNSNSRRPSIERKLSNGGTTTRTVSRANSDHSEKTEQNSVAESVEIPVDADDGASKKSL